MRNIKIALFGLIITLISVSTFISCSNSDHKSENKVSTKQIEELLLNKYGLTKVNNSIVNLHEISIEGKSIANENVTIYQIENSNMTMILIPNIDNSNKVTLIKGNIVNGTFIEEKVLEVLSNLDKNGNGNVSIFNSTDNYGFSSTFKDGKTTATTLTSTSNGIQARRTLCQREKDEDFKACFARESTEFCDGFVATVAFITNPGIAVLIAALCTC